MNKDTFHKLNLADGYAIGTFQTFEKKLGNKTQKPYGRIGVLIGKTVHDFFDIIPPGVTTLDTYKRPDWAVGQVMLVHQPRFEVQNGRLNAGCNKIEPITDK